MTQDRSSFSGNCDIRLPRVMLRLRNLFIAVLMMFPFTAEQAKSDLVHSLELTLDETTLLDIGSIEVARFRPVEQTIILGYSTAAVWLRLWIDPAPDGGEVVVLVRPSMLDSVKFYAPIMANQEGTVRPSAAPSHEKIESEWPASLRGYRISPPEGGGEYFVRIASTGTIGFQITATPVREAIRINLITDFAQIVYLAFMLVLLLWSLRMLTLTNEHIFRWFAVMQASWLFHNIIAFGYAAVLTPLVALDTTMLALRVFVIVSSGLSIIFHRAVMLRFQPSVLAIRLLDLQLAGITLAFILFCTLDRQLALQINAYCVAATPFTLLLNAFTARKAASPGLKTMRIIYGLLSVILMFWIFSLLGIGKVSLASLYGAMIHGLSTGILMFTILHLYVRDLLAAAKTAETQLAAIEHQRTHQQERNRTLAQFIDMMSHETRNALAVINMSLSQPTISDRQRGRISEAIVGLTGLIDRCNQTIRLDSDNQVISAEACDLVDILHRLCDGQIERERLFVRADGTQLLQSDPVLLAVVFSNLIDNALKYSPPGSAVTVTLAKNPDMRPYGFCVLIENEEGEFGHPDPVMAFQKYYRNQLANAKIGSGLGLYIVRGLLAGLGGKIAYEPTPGYVRFRVWMPC
jgi:signal transduction histidine kinase